VFFELKATTISLFSYVFLKIISVCYKLVAYYIWWLPVIYGGNSEEEPQLPGN